MSELISPYSLIKTGTKDYNKALKSIRRNYKKYGVGFDNSEIWNVDITIYKYVLLHKLCEHPFLEICASDGLYTYNKYWEDQGITRDEYDENHEMYCKKEDELRQEVNLQISHLTDKGFLEFILPRLRAFKDGIKSYAADMTCEQYEEYLQSIIDEIRKKGTCTLIYEHFNSLWS